MTDQSIDNPILNSPYDPPEAHFELGPHGPTGVIKPGRRPSESFIPIPAAKRGAADPTFDFDATGERREKNSLINDIRFEVDRWRARNYTGVTPITRKLLLHWAARRPERDDPMFFCQREAAETAIFLAEVAGRHGHTDFRTRIDPENKLHNNDLPRVALKMATGTGKTVVMAMLIAWQSINKAVTPRDARFTKRFLVVTPGITIRDRLRVLQPSAPDNYYAERDLVPTDLKGALQQAQVIITNFHTFLYRDAKEIQGVASNTRRILTAGKDTDPFKETPDQMVTRVLDAFQGRGKSEIVVLNDEAHHCYRDRPLDEGQDKAADAQEKKEIAERAEGARVWFSGLEAIRKKVGIKSVYDLSATPFYLKGSGYNEGFIFPWVVSDFSLMDAIESGIVKVPRIPIDDDASTEQVTYLHLWEFVGKDLPKRKNKKLEEPGSWTPPKELEGALRSLYRSYEKSFDRYATTLAALGEPPPVLIVVCPNTIVSKLVYDWIAGYEIPTDDDTTVGRPGELSLLSNVEDGRFLGRPRTILIDSAQLESGDVLGKDFRQAAAQEIDAFKAEKRRREPGADVEKLTDEDVLREVMNTVGKRGKLGEQVRCVVSVSMLTEGWDANTVTHILGIRAFRSQLLCEQVVGRGLRRRSYAVNEDDRFEPEYAEVYGVPFAFIPSDVEMKEPPPKPPAVEVYAVADRAGLRITFPKLDGYRIEMPDRPFHLDIDAIEPFDLSEAMVATKSQVSGLVGESDEHTIGLDNVRTQQIAYAIAKRLVEGDFALRDDEPRPWLFPHVVSATKQWLDERVITDEKTPKGLLLISENTRLVAEHLSKEFLYQYGTEEGREQIILPILRRFDPEGSTDDVYFTTRKATIETTKSHVNRVTLDGAPDGNTWEQIVAMALEANDDVHSYVKNDRLGFTIPYLHKGVSHEYVTDFLVRLKPRAGDVERTLIVEVSGGQKSPGPTSEKATTAQFRWCAAVNNHGGWGRWGFTEITHMPTAKPRLAEAIENLYADGTVTGLRDLGD